MRCARNRPRQAPGVAAVGAFALCILVAACQAVGTKSTPHDDPSRSPGSGSSEPRSCTEMACSDQASIRAQLTPAQATPGEHKFVIKTGTEEHSCTLSYPADLKDTSAIDAQCSEGLSLRMGPSMRGVETRQGDTVMYTEVPIPGQFEWNLTIVGQPTDVSVVHTLADTVILQRSEALSYRSVAPNGEGCEPVCQQASITWPRAGG